MIVTVVYYEESSKAPKLITFSDINKAKEWLGDNTRTNLNNKQNPRIMVDYGVIEAYQEMYELMKEKVFNTSNSVNNKRTEI